jgi:hypothetical protein
VIAAMPDRRRHFRRTFDSLEYLQISATNGGFLLDLSEGGLCAQLSRPTGELKTIPFSLFFGQDSRIDSSGQVAWRNSAGTVVGLSFLELSLDSRQLILQKVYRALSGAEARPSADHSPLDEMIAVPEIVENAGSEISSKPRSAGPQLVVPLSAPPEGILARSFLSPPYFGLEEVAQDHRPIPFPVPQRAASPSAVPERNEPPVASFRAEENRQPPRSNRFGIASALILVACLLLVSRLIFHGGPREAAARTSAPSPASVPLQPVALSAPAHVSLGTPANDAGAQAFSDGLRLLQGSSGAPDSIAAAKSFWDAVGNGSTPAEVALARLYLHGEGVSKNCDQANVLLEAAARRGNTEASELLQSLKTNPCH